jgi:general stress protein YciG
VTGRRSAVTRILELVRRALCGVRGHTLVRCFEKDRLSLQCLNCAFRTAGWTVPARREPPRPKVPGLSFAQRATRRPIGHIAEIMKEAAVKKDLRGFASMDEDKQRRIARLGGKAAHAKGTAHEWTTEQARAAGRKGGLARARNAQDIVRGKAEV